MKSSSPIEVQEIAFSCYMTNDVARARAFYEGHFGFTPTYITEMECGSVWWEYDIGGAALSFGKADGMEPGTSGATVFLEVANFDEAIASLKAADVTFVFDAFDTPVCRMAIILDSEGNKLGIHKRNADHPCCSPTNK